MHERTHAHRVTRLGRRASNSVDEQLVLVAERTVLFPRIDSVRSSGQWEYLGGLAPLGFLESDCRSHSQRQRVH